MNHKYTAARTHKLSRTPGLKSHQLQQSNINNPRARAKRTHASTTHTLQCKQVFVCTLSRACQLRNKTKQLWGLRHPLCSATYCLQSQACILYSKLGRAKPCGKCALKNTKSYTLPWKLPHTEPDRLGMDNIPFCFSIYSGKIWPLTCSISNSKKEAARECYAWVLAKWEEG